MSMSAEQHLAVIRRLFDEAWNGGNPAVTDELCAPTYVNHDASNPMVPVGPAGLQQIIAMFRTGFPDLSMTVEDMMATTDGDKVVTRWTARGTHLGMLQEIAPTGRTVAVPGIRISRMADGKITEEWVVWDTLAMMMQLGLVPPPAEMAP